jgi:hypothetical protein
VLTASVERAVRELAGRRRVTEFAVVARSFGLAIQALSGESHVEIGSYVVNEPQEDFDLGRRSNYSLVRFPVASGIGDDTRIGEVVLNALSGRAKNDCTSDAPRFFCFVDDHPVRSFHLDGAVVSARSIGQESHDSPIQSLLDVDFALYLRRGQHGSCVNLFVADRCMELIDPLWRATMLELSHVGSSGQRGPNGAAEVSCVDKAVGVVDTLSPLPVMHDCD